MIEEMTEKDNIKEIYQKVYEIAKMIEKRDYTLELGLTLGKLILMDSITCDLNVGRKANHIDLARIINEVNEEYIPKFKELAKEQGVLK